MDKRFSNWLILLVFLMTACAATTPVPGSSSASPTAPTRQPEATPSPLPSNTPTPEGRVYQSDAYGFSIQIPPGYRVAELPLRSGFLLSIGFSASDREYTNRYGYPLGLAVYQKPVEVPLLDWFATHIGGLTDSGQPTSPAAFFYDPIIHNQDAFKGQPALRYLSGNRPIPFETLVDQGAWAIGFYYLQDYPDDYEPVYQHMLASLEFFEPIGGHIAAATPPTPDPTPTVCLDPVAEPRLLPNRTTPLEVQFNSDGNIWVWEEDRGLAEQISHTGDAGRFSFSPDGQVIAIERRLGSLGDEDYSEDYKVELWAIDRDGSDLRQLVSVEQFDAFIPEREEAWAANLPSWFYWTPGTHLLTFGVFPMINALGADASIAGYWQVNADTLELRPTGQPPETKHTPGLLSPDGAQRAILGESSLSLVNEDGSHLRENVLAYQTFPVEGGGPGRIYPQIEWAQDSQSLLAITFSGNWYSSPDPTFTTWRVPVDGSPARELHTFPGLYYWVSPLSPNQKYLAYKTHIQPMTNDLELHLARFDGTQDVVYAAGYGYEFLHWHPDSYHFVYDQWEILRPFLGSVCGGSVPLLEAADTPATEIQWVDATRFIFVKGSLDPLAGPRQLHLGQIDGPSILIGPYNGDDASYRFNLQPAPLGQGE